MKELNGLVLKELQLGSWRIEELRRQPRESRVEGREQREIASRKVCSSGEIH